MANTGWFSAGSSPTTEAYCEATATRNGSSVTVSCIVKTRHKYSDGFMGTGKVVTICASSNLGGSGSVVHHKSTDSWSGTAEHTSTFSFTFTDTANTSATITFWSERQNISGTSYQFSGKTVSVSFGAFTAGDIDQTFYIRLCNDNPYLEFMGRAELYIPTWSATNGQDDIQWQKLNAGSWDRAGLNYRWAVGYNHANANVNHIWYTHIYDMNKTRCYGTISWFPRIYVAYNANGGSSTPSKQTKNIGDQLTLASAISRTHYSFKGWSTSSTATSASYSAGQVIDYEAWNSLGSSMSNNNGWNTNFPANPDNGNTVTLYAVWAGNTYTVSYNANGGSSTPSSKSVTYPNSTTLSSAIARNNGTSTSNGTITVSYNVNGGNSTAPTASTGTYVNTTTTKYTFEKWHAGSATGTAYSAGASYQPTANVTMYAGWTSSSSTARTTNPSITLTGTKPTKANTTVSSYTVAYNANGGSSTPTTQTATKTRKYTFSKWNSKSDGTGTDYNSSTAYTFSANATLYAKYTSSDSGGSVTLANAISKANGSTTGYSVSYNANGGSGAPSAQTSGNRTITYTFNKWAAGSATGTTYSAGGSFTPSANTTMYATWNSSTSANSSWTCSSTTPTRTGYTFLGWSTSNTATTAAYKAGTAYTITGALTLYAVWQANTYTITYDKNGGTTTPDAQSAKYGTTITLANAITKANTETTGTITITYNDNGGHGTATSATGTYVNTTPYTFNKWAVGSATGTTTYAAGSEFTIPANNTTLYATWTTGTTTRKTNPSIAITTSEPIQTGYTFLGWSTDKTATTATYLSGQSYTFSQNTTLYAVWQANKPYKLYLWGVGNTTTTIDVEVEYSSAISITSFKLYYKKESDSQYTAFSGTIADLMTIKNLTPDTNYLIYYVVSNATGSTTSETLTYSTLLGEPTITTPVASNLLPFSCTITATGSTTPSRTLSYRFSKDGGTTWTNFQSSNSYNWTGLNEETSYNMKVEVKATHTGNNSADTTKVSDVLVVTTPADQAKARYKVDGEYKQGKAYYKDNGEWKKVKKIYKKVNGQWQIGQNS